MRTIELAGPFTAFLNRRWPTLYTVTLFVAPDEYCAVSGDGSCGFGAYAREDNIARIIVISPAAWAEILHGESAGDAEREFLLTIAHEYAHCLQDSGEYELSEEDADVFAEKALDEFLRTRATADR